MYALFSGHTAGGNKLVTHGPYHAADVCAAPAPVQVKLIDLGMAGLYRPKRPVKGCMGSPGFIAPEVILGEAHSVSDE